MADDRGLVLSLPFKKIDHAKREVWGYATTDQVDQQGEVVDYEASKVAFAEFAGTFERVSGGESLGNIREMHQPKSVGKMIAYQPDDAHKGIWIGAKLSDSADGQDAWTKVQEHVLNGFSIGAPRAERRMEYVDGKPRQRVVGYKLSEVSLVDNPACPGSFFQEVKLAKSALAVMDDDAAPRGDDHQPVGLATNAFVDGAGQVWKMVPGRGVATDTSKISKKEATVDATAELLKGKNIGPGHHSEGKGPGVETPKVQGDPEPHQVKPKQVADGMPEASAVIPGGPHDAASKPVAPPATQGKAADAGPFGQPQAAPQNQMPPPPPAPAMPGQPPPQQQGGSFAYCAYCAGKLANGASPYHTECQPKPQAAPQQAPMQYAAAAGVDALQKAFVSGMEGFQKSVSAQFDDMKKTLTASADQSAALEKRIAQIEKTPIPGGPERTELPEGVRPVQKGGDVSPEMERLALEKAIGRVSSPFLKDQLSRELAKGMIADALSGKK